MIHKSKKKLGYHHFISSKFPQDLSNNCKILLTDFQLSNFAILDNLCKHSTVQHKDQALRFSFHIHPGNICLISNLA